MRYGTIYPEVSSRLPAERVDGTFPPASLIRKKWFKLYELKLKLIEPVGDSRYWGLGDSLGEGQSTNITATADMEELCTVQRRRRGIEPMLLHYSRLGLMHKRI